MTPTQVLADVRSQITETSPAFWTDSELRSYLSQAETIMAQKLDCVQDTSSVTSVPGTRNYNNPDNCITTSRVEYNGQKLKKIDQKDADCIEGDTTTTGTPVYYYDYADTINLVPTPTTASTLKWYYTGQPTAIASDSTAFSVPKYFTQYLSDYAIYRAFLKDQELRGEADMHYQLWSQNLEQAETIWYKKRYRDRNFTVKQEDEYPSTDLGII